MGARPIGQIVRPIIARALAMNGFHRMLAAAPPRQREDLIVSAAANGEITRAEALGLMREHETAR
jgi:hypothetical protein